MVGYRSIITDVFDGELLSSVRCLTCHHISDTKEEFQDISLSIPTLEQLECMRGGFERDLESGGGIGNDAGEATSSMTTKSANHNTSFVPIDNSIVNDRDDNEDETMDVDAQSPLLPNTLRKDSVGFFIIITPLQIFNPLV